MTDLNEFNRLVPAAAAEMILQCCGSTRWAGRMAASRPYRSIEELAAAADAHWRAMQQGDFLEAFGHHPRIGRPDSPAGEHPGACALAAREQAGAARACAQTRASLAQYNDRYEKKFGFIFIVCATGKSAGEMLEMLRARMGNTREQEIANAAAEQGKITQLRIRKIFSRAMSQITTHILDISRGKPASGVRLSLARRTGGEWAELGEGITDEDGRAAGLPDTPEPLPAGEYRLTFDTGAYHAAANTPCFHPQVEIRFCIAGDGQHYHIPLLLSPFGYSTYRGS